jgi:diguanylate cyclase (GGDEF)-like protein/PAS domain S-box-containing protein
MTPKMATILVVDDDADARLVMRAALRKAGYEVRMAEGGHDALRQFRSQACELVMLDVDMPDLGGHEVCTLLRAEAGPLLPIVMVTGMDDVASVETAYQHGATDFIAKPVNWALLGHRVRYLLRSHQAMLDLRAAEARNAAVLSAIPDLLFEVDINGRYIDYRAPRADLLAAPGETLIGRTVADVLPPAAAEVCMTALRCAFENGFSNGAQYELQLAAGSAWFELAVSRKSVNAGETPRFIVLARDITERKLAEASIARLAYFDSLTGLPNRQSFLERVDREVRRAGQQHEKLAVLFMDLDGFKTINDTMGHAAGDLILKWAAERLRDSLRPSDLLSRPMVLGNEREADIKLARLGGDEFTALLLNIENPEDVMAVAQRIGEQMRRPFVVEGREVNLSASIGIALYPDDGQDAATLLKHADTAMYHAKNSGRDNAQVYSASLTRDILRRLELNSHLRAALDRDEFHLVYQPQVDVASGRIHSVEALIRWSHPTRGLVSPLEFIPLAEETGLIERIGAWVLDTACSQAAQWHRTGLPVNVAVNLSPLQFGTPSLPGMVMNALATASLAPQHLELEVTEGALMENSAATRTSLETLRDHGVRVALDDFGTGYSSLAYLTRMPISHIKIDRCFVTGLLQGGESEAVVRAVLAMAHSLGMRVTAEGVETFEQACVLKALACDGLQGYYFSRPVAAHDILALLSRHWSLDSAGPARGGNVIAVRRPPVVVR